MRGRFAGAHAVIFSERGFQSRLEHPAGNCDVCILSPLLVKPQDTTSEELRENLEGEALII